MKRIIKIGTRESALALFQAEKVKSLLEKMSISAILVIMKSEGDIDLKTPLYAMGVQGIFTKTLDTALLNERIDIAVHSQKDVPVQVAQGLYEAAILERDAYHDILVYNDNADFLIHEKGIATIATSSVRRQAQWRNRYPNHHVENLRGNVNTRLQKLKDSAWNGAIFAAAGLERIGIRPPNSLDLSWMLPAPAQGAIAVYCRENDPEIREICQQFNHAETALCTHLERQFLKTLMGGCSAPIAALATLHNDILTFKGCVLSRDGSTKIDVERYAYVDKAADIALQSAYEILENGGKDVIEDSKKALKGFQKWRKPPCFSQHTPLFKKENVAFEANLSQLKLAYQ